MRKAGLSFFVFAFLMIVGIDTPHAASLADIDYKQCVGLDIVFLVSHSVSMNSLNDSSDNLRLRSLKTAINILGDNAAYLCSGFQHRVAVIGFGDEQGELPDTREFLDTTIIAPNIESYQTWVDFKNDEMFGTLAEAFQSYSIGRYTNYKDALAEGADLLASWRTYPLDTTRPREQAVIILSDGAMCTHEYLCNNTSKIIEEIEPIVDPAGSRLPGDISIYHLGFYSLLGQGTQFFEIEAIKNFWESIASKHRGSLILLNHDVTATGQRFINNNVDAEMANILGDLLGSDLGGAKCNVNGNGLEPIWIEPYKNNFFVLYIFKQGAAEGYNLEDVDVTINVYQEGSQPVYTIRKGMVNSETFPRPLYNPNGPNEEYVFFSPPPGRYEIIVDKADPCRDVSVQFGTQSVLANLIKPSENDTLTEVDQSPYYDTNSPVRLTFQLVQLNNEGIVEVVKQLPGFPIESEVRVYLESETEGELLFEKIYEDFLPQDSGGFFVAEEPFLTQYPGTYHWEYTAKTKNPQRWQNVSAPEFIEVVSAEGSLDVLHLDRDFSFQILSPQNGDYYLTDLQDSTSLSVMLQIYDMDGVPLRDDLLISEIGSSPLIAHLSEIQDGKAIPLDTQVMERLSGNQYTTTLGIAESLDEKCFEVKVDLTTDIVSYFHPTNNEHLVNFCLKKRPFTFQLTEPAAESKIIILDGQELSPVEVAVQISDDKNQPLTNWAIADAQAKLFKIELIDGAGNIVLENTNLKLQSDNLYTTQLKDFAQYPRGCYSLNISLASVYEQRFFSPKTTSVSQNNICILDGIRFAWTLENPIQNASYTTRPAFNWFAAPDLKNTLRIAVRDSAGRAIDGASMLSQELPLFKGQLVESRSGKTFEVTFVPGSTAGSFIGEWPKGTVSNGVYRLENIMLETNNLIPTWIPENQKLAQATTFHLQEQPWTMPWSLLAAFLGGGILILMGVLIYLSNGPLYGASINFVRKPGTTKLISFVGGDVEASRLFRTRGYIISEKQLENLLPGSPYRKIKIEHKEDEEGMAIDLEFTAVKDDEEKEENFSVSEADAKNGVSVGDDVIVRVFTKPSSLLSRSWVAFLIGFMLLLIWFGIFAYLYYGNVG